jgi:hypothetical protein
MVSPASAKVVEVAARSGMATVKVAVTTHDAGVTGYGPNDAITSADVI